MHKDVIVIGAGISGIGAAYNLQKSCKSIHAGNRALTMTMSSLLFYFNPTTQLMIGIFIYDASFRMADAITFGLIWVGIAVYFASRPSAVKPVV